MERRARLGVSPYRNGWPGIKVRWCTRQLKTNLITKEVNRLKKEKNALHYIGIVTDEAKRRKNDPNHRYPLVEWGITEAQALQIRYDWGFDFGGLYRIYHCASCWCCPFQRIDEPRKLRWHHPELWGRLWDMTTGCGRSLAQAPLGSLRSVGALGHCTVG